MTPRLEIHTFTTILCLVIYHFFLVMFCWTYLRTLLTSPGKVENDAGLYREEVDNITATTSMNPEDSTNSVSITINESHQHPPLLSIAAHSDAMHNYIETTRDGNPRWCKHCHIFKPDRTHHCRSCARCIPKEDHHCPWFNQCIGLENHKFFSQFLCYAAGYCLFVFVTSIGPLWEEFQSVNQHNTIDGIKDFLTELSFHHIFLCISSFIFSIVMILFASSHIYLLLHNTTTLESIIADSSSQGLSVKDPTTGRVIQVFTDRGKWIWDLGYKRNWEMVMGTKLWEWVFPVVNQNERNRGYRRAGDLVLYNTEVFLE